MLERCEEWFVDCGDADWASLLCIGGRTDFTRADDSRMASRGEHQRLVSIEWASMAVTLMIAPRRF